MPFSVPTGSESELDIKTPSTTGGWSVPEGQETSIENGGWSVPAASSKPPSEYDILQQRHASGEELTPEEATKLYIGRAKSRNLVEMGKGIPGAVAGLNQQIATTGQELLPYIPRAMGLKGPSESAKAQADLAKAAAEAGIVGSANLGHIGKSAVRGWVTEPLGILQKSIQEQGVGATAKALAPAALKAAFIPGQAVSMVLQGPGGVAAEALPKYAGETAKKSLEQTREEGLEAQRRAAGEESYLKDVATAALGATPRDIHPLAPLLMGKSADQPIFEPAFAVKVGEAVAPPKELATTVQTLSLLEDPTILMGGPIRSLVTKFLPRLAEAGLETAKIAKLRKAAIARDNLLKAGELAAGNEEWVAAVREASEGLPKPPILPEGAGTAAPTGAVPPMMPPPMPGTPEAVQQAGQRFAAAAEEAAAPQAPGPAQKTAQMGAQAAETLGKKAGAVAEWTAGMAEKYEKPLSIAGALWSLSHGHGLGHATLSAMIPKFVERAGKAVAEIKTAGAALRTLAEADWNSRIPVWRQVAKNMENAPAWLVKGVSKPVIGELTAGELAERGIRAASRTAQAGLHGAETGFLMGLAQPQQTGEELGGQVGAGLALGTGMHMAKGAFNLPQIGAMTPEDRAIAMATDAMKQAAKDIREGSDPLAIARTSDAVMSNATLMQHLFKGVTSGGKELGVSLQDNARFQREAPENQKGAVAYYEPTQHQIVVNVERSDPGGRLLHEAAHPLFESMLTSKPEMLRTFQETFTPYMLQAAREIYATNVGHAGASMSDLQIVSELFSDVLADQLRGLDLGTSLRKQKAGAAVNQFVERDAKGALTRRSELIQAAMVDPYIVSAVRSQFEALRDFRPLVDSMQERGVKLRADQAGKHPGLERGSDFVEVLPDGRVVAASPQQVAKKANSRRAETRALYPDTEPVPAGQGGTNVAVRELPSGGQAKTGTTLGNKFYQTAQTFGSGAKALARRIEQAIAAGETVSGWYQEIGEKAKGWAGSVRENLGNIEAKFKDFIPYAFEVTKQGNILVKVVSLTGLDRKAQVWAQNKGTIFNLDAWGGSVDAFKTDVQTYLKNHAEGRPGSDGIGETKKNLINAFLVGQNRTFEAFNPLRAQMGPKEREGVISSYRLDRLQTVEPSSITGYAPADYGKWLRNLSGEVRSAAETKQAYAPETVQNQAGVPAERQNRNPLWQVPGAGSSDRLLREAQGGGQGPLTAPAEGPSRMLSGEALPAGSQGVTLEDRAKRQKSPKQLKFDFDTAVEGLGSIATALPPGAGVPGVPERGPGGVFGEVQPTTFSVTASRLKRILKEGPANPIGMPAHTPQDRHAVAALFRNPAFETMRWVFLKDGRVAHIANITGREPGMTVAFKPGTAQEAISKMSLGLSRDEAAIRATALKTAEIMRGVDADSFFITHNHPSGNSLPSDADIRVTAALSRALGQSEEVGKPSLGARYKFLGHVIVDHTVHHVIDAIGDVHAVEMHPTEADPFLDAKSALQDHYIGEPGDLARIGKAVSSGNGTATLIFQDARGHVRMVGELNQGADPIKIAEEIRTFGKQIGAHRAFAYSTDTSPENLRLLSALTSTVLTDALTPSGSLSNPMRSVVSLETPYSKVPWEMQAVSTPKEKLRFSGEARPKEFEEINPKDFIQIKDYDHAQQLFDRGYVLFGGEYDGFEEMPVRLNTATDIQKFDPENLVAVSPSKAMASGEAFSAEEPGFYSKLERVIDSEMKGASMPAAQLKAVLRNRGVKQEELKWTKVDEKIDRLAAENGGKVPKEELLSQLRGGRSMMELQNEKVGTKWEVFGESGFSKTFNSEKSANAARETAIQRWADSLEDAYRAKQREDGKWIVVDEYGDPARISSENGQTYLSTRDVFADEDTAKMSIRSALEMVAGNEIGIRQWLSDPTQFKEFTLPGGENYREIALVDPEIQKWLGGSNHDFTYDELANINSRRIAHMRVKDRVDSNERPGLFIEEIQSDRHQEGRAVGYQENIDWSKIPVYEYKDLVSKGVFPGVMHIESKPGKYVLVDANGESIAQSSSLETLKQEYNAWINRKGIPDAPFRKDWPLQMFKRALQDAVESGKQWVGWTDGQTQVNRYNLSKQVDRIDYRRNGPDSYDLGVIGKNGVNLISEESVSLSRISDVVGKEIAEKIKNVEGTPGGDRMTLSGVDLEIGGEGMKGFYDRMLPKEISKYVKQWGATVEQAPVRTREEYGETVNAWKVDISPEMAESIKTQGQERYSGEAKPTEPYERNLVAMHNTTEAGVREILRLGGVPVPSVAVTKRDIPFSDFGDITLIGRRELVDPQADRRNKLFAADIYSGRQPRAESVPTKNGPDRVLKTVDDALPEGLKLTSAETYGLLDELRASGPDNRTRVKGALAENFKVRLAFLNSEGIQVPLEKYIRIDNGYVSEKDILNAPRLMEAVMSLPKESGYDFYSSLTEGQHARLTEAFKDEIIKKLKDTPDLAAKMIKYAVGEPVAGVELKSLPFNLFDKLVSDVRRVAKNEVEVDPWKMNGEARKLIQEHKDAEYGVWLENLVDTLYDPNRIFRSGSKRIPYTLKNLASEMSSSKIRGEEGGAGLGKARGMVTPEIKSIEEAHAKKASLAPASKVETAKMEQDQLFFPLLLELRKYAPRFSGEINVRNDLYDLVEKVMKNPKGVDRFLTKAGYTEVPSVVVSKLLELAKATKESPTQYFEAKPQRGVALNEFAAAVVPERTSSAVIKALEKAGLKVEKYGVRSEHLEAVNRAVDATQAMFSGEARPAILEPRPEMLGRIPGGKIKAEKLVPDSPTKFANIVVGETAKSSTKSALETTPANRERFLTSLSEAVRTVESDPARFASNVGYAEFMKKAGVYGDIMAAPPLLKVLLETPQKYVDLVSGQYHGDKTKPGTIEAAMSGLDSTANMRKVILAANPAGAPPPIVTALHHLWGILSRMLPPIHQEAAWLRLVSQPEVLFQIQKSIDGTYDLNQAQWDAVVTRAFDATRQTDNKLGNNAKSNANSFGNMLYRWNGVWDRASSVYAAPGSIPMGREFWSIGKGPVGIKNKVQRFIGLTFGIPGLIMDRWKFVEFYMGQYGIDPQKYFNYTSSGTPEDPAGLYAAYGGLESSNPTLSLAFYEGMETALQRAIQESPELRGVLGRHANVGGLHWVGWNAIKNEAVGHSSLDLTRDLLEKHPNPSGNDLLELLSKKEYYTEGLDGNTFKRFSLKKP